MRRAASETELPKLPIDLDTDAKQEAARFLTSSMDARPMIRGIVAEQRLSDWETVADQLDVEQRQVRALRQRREALVGDAVDASDQFEPASEMRSETAVADGGAEVVEEDEQTDAEADGDVWEPREDQEVVEYEDPADRESQKREAASIAKIFDDADQVREKIAEERDSETVRPHMIDALKERLEALEE